MSSKYSFLKYILLFIIFSFLGSLIEYLSFLLGGQGLGYDKVLFLLTGLKIYFIPIYGLSGVIIFSTEKLMNKFKFPFWTRGFIHGLTITLIEFIFGNLGFLIFNVNFWDYTDKFLNIGKYVSFSTFIVWVFLGYLFSGFMKLIKKQTFK